jgi:hypothetical protein
MFVGPAVIMAGIARNHTWAYFQAYSWLGGSSPLSELSATYWIGVSTSIIGFLVFAGGITGSVLAFLLEHRIKGKTS